MKKAVYSSASWWEERVRWKKELRAWARRRMVEGCEVAWARRRGTMALMSAEGPETCRVAGTRGGEGAEAGAVAGGRQHEEEL